MPRAKTSKRHMEHGKRIYNIWSQIKYRCQTETCKDYKNYGGRGIKVYEEWINSFDNFYEWSIENGYGENLTIDRMNNDKDYSPSNCRWATSQQQASNRRTRHEIEIGGKFKSISEWEKEYGLPTGTIANRVRKRRTGTDLISELNSLNKKDTYFRTKRKIDIEQAIEISKMIDDNVPLKVIASIYNLDPSTISNIKSGKSWSHITGRRV